MTLKMPDNRGEKNPMYKGDKAGYAAIHAWVKRRKPKPEFCENCGIRPVNDLANKTGKYLRDSDDWNYLCRKCHMDSDGRNDQLRLSGKSRKLPNQICVFCGIEFHKDNIASFCSRKCYMLAGGRYWQRKETRTENGLSVQN